MSRDPFKTTPEEIPDGMAVERMAVAMAAANGQSWKTLDQTFAEAYRRASHGGLLMLGAHAAVVSETRLIAALVEGAAALRLAADLLEHNEALIQRCYKAASTLEIGWRSVEAVAEPEPEEVI